MLYKFDGYKTVRSQCYTNLMAIYDCKITMLYNFDGYKTVRSQCYTNVMAVRL